MVRTVARARTTKRRKVGRVKPPAKESSRERAGWGRAWWMCWSGRRAARAFRARRRRRLRSRRRDRPARPRGGGAGAGGRAAAWGSGYTGHRSLLDVDAGVLDLHGTKKAPSQGVLADGQHAGPEAALDLVGGGALCGGVTDVGVQALDEGMQGQGLVGFGFVCHHRVGPPGWGERGGRLPLLSLRRPSLSRTKCRNCRRGLRLAKSG